MATIKVNLSLLGNACGQDPTPAGVFPGPGWYAMLSDCLGNPFVHAGKEYGPFPVDHGYVEIPDVPPGTYLLYAIVNPHEVVIEPGVEIIFQSNYVTHFAVLEVCCGCRDYCVKLYNPGWHYCIRVIIYWFGLLASAGKLSPGISDDVVRALTAASQVGDTLETDANMNAQLATLTAAFQKTAKSS